MTFKLIYKVKILFIIFAPCSNSPNIIQQTFQDLCRIQEGSLSSVHSQKSLSCTVSRINLAFTLCSTSQAAPVY